MWRGAAIAMIFINHIPRNILSFFTSGNWGLSDNADLFVFLSGLSLAGVLMARHAESRESGFRYTVSRGFTLYVAHLGLMLAVAMVCAIYLAVMQSDALAKYMIMRPIFTQTDLVVGKIVTLTYLPRLMDILPMYMTMIVMTGFVIALVRHQEWFRAVLHSRSLIAVSVTLVAVGVAGAAPWAFTISFPTGGPCLRYCGHIPINRAWLCSAIFIFWPARIWLTS